MQVPLDLKDQASRQQLDRLLDADRVAEAEDVARALLADEDSHVQGATGLARCAFARDDLDGALRWSGRAARFAPNDIALKAFHGALLTAAGRPAEAVALLENQAEQAVTPTASIALAQALARLGSQDRLLPLVARLLHRFPPAIAPLLADLAEHTVLSGMTVGWAAADPDLCITGALSVKEGISADSVLRIDSPHGPLLALALPAFLQRFGRSGGPQGLFRFAVPLDATTEGEELALTLSGVPLLGSPLRPLRCAPVEGSAVLEGSVLSGWAWCPGDPPRQVAVRVGDSTGRSVTFAADRPIEAPGDFGMEDGKYGFLLDLEKTSLTPGLLQVTAGAGDTPLAGSPLPWPGPNRAIRLPAPVLPPPARPGRSLRPPAAIDVVIPVYRGRSETLACLHAVLATVAGLPCEIVVVDDATPEPDLARDLDALAAEGRITLLRNERNLGFPATVNRGLKSHFDGVRAKRDVVLLNADTLVAGDWLVRLRAAAWSAPDIGTVTPLSNDATILSYPSGQKRPPAPTSAGTQALDRIAATVNAGLRVELPTAVGFCTYIRHDCLEETGLLEERLFGRGYGEENDFCLRARQRGWRHVAAADVFVAHVGGRSFGRHKTILGARNGRLLESLHPGYDALVRAFIKDDPLMAARRRLDLARWTAGPDHQAILLVTLGGRGGVARFVEERSAALRAEGRRVLRLVPETDEDEEAGDERDAKRRDGEGKGDDRRASPAPLPAERRCRIVVDARPDLHDLTFRTRTEFAELVSALRQAGVAAVEFHHLMGHDPLVLDLPGRLGVPYDLVVHDYGLICPRVNLVDGGGRYCGEPDLAACERCTADPRDRFDPDLTVTALRRRSRHLAAGARRITVPTRDVADRLLRHIQPRPVTVTPWETVVPVPGPRPPRTREGRWRICTIGAVGIQKGYEILLACARDAAARDLPLEFVVVGFTEEDPPLFATGRAFVVGRFHEEEAVDLVRAQGAHLAFLPSISPETWCYALSTAWRSGLQVAAFDLGALGERIRAHGGHLLPPSLDASAINDALLGLLDAHTLSGVAIDPPVPVRPGPGPGGLAAPDMPDRHRPTFRSRGVSSMFGSAAPAEAAQSSQIKATAQTLALTPGFYSLIVTNGGGAAVVGDFPLPSVQLAAAPNAAAGTDVEMIGTAPGNWLTKPGDVVIIKVSGGTANVVLTSYKHVDRPNALLNLQVARIDDAVAPQAAPISQAASMPAAPMPIGPAPVPQQAPLQITRPPRTEILAHIQRQGDMRFADGNWAGCVGQRQWIEAFSITPVEGLAPEDIEYKGLTANGWETPWISGGNMCGSRGLGTPLIGFSIRLRGAAAERFDCHYEGAFVSGHRSAPGLNGTPCRSDAIGDPLEGILLRIVEKQAGLRPGFL
ncbi:glycosyltransferase [Azospirillum thermophilum]|uniref:Glycosyl transferase n=1 Tax=Azospirillum thermophilum TaxID=2202148 RepID=A0A2S2D0B2_9PROT|nr:glycosyltransferase [Azospirillum thermophilum]AWK90203.1 glycosyl transferase [Azospirillum thermophilum]